MGAIKNLIEANEKARKEGCSTLPDPQPGLRTGTSIEQRLDPLCIAELPEPSDDSRQVPGPVGSVSGALSS
ncbi:MAG: hypothetical protein QOJ88_1771 [Pyrinomonadaceae bacterium]|jgi:hypothetical protein|nr:hypothetical protein [Pyrinomonadaceae bacterium]MDQ1728276.1 hypothetical protein [Pyrinomonadaceae bacterium]